MQTLLRSFFFFVLLTKGNPLECEVCTDIGTSCIGRMKTCAVGQDTCIIVFLENTVEGKVLQTIAKGCGSSEKCNSIPKRMTIGHQKHIWTSLNCCTGKACATITPVLSQGRKPKANGKQCPSCYSMSGTCKADMVNCTGPEWYCFDVLSRSNDNGVFRDITMKGCTTKSTCAAINKGVPPILEEKDTIVVGARCTPEPSRGSRSSGLSLSIFSGILFLKIPW